MFFEKKKLKKFAESPALADLLMALTLLIILANMIYVAKPFSTDFWSIKLIDIINAIAQFATAGAFVFAVFQYRKNKESERQEVLIKECRDLVDRMCVICGDFSGNKRQGIKETTKFVTKMSSLGNSFDEIFKELEEDTHKAIIRMHWQEMYFSDLQHAMESWSLGDIFHDLGINAEQPDRLRLMQSRDQRIRRADITDLFAEYKVVKHILQNKNISSQLMKTAQITQDYLFFELRFFLNSGLKDHLYGYLNIINAQVRAPALTALNEFFHQDLKDLMLKHDEHN
ncbi:hypothetical protein [Pseudomonas huanghezhanensis]|uniref:hypothetical protein n=1 Tax=Pseudomonas huanghezhanensis TaxID=3002903 RepID=UPI0022854488|nr:hypothetical protein [Pseudomonas sp. BSw22131]